GQQRISQLTYGIVGLGGMGSLVAQQLAHLGARKFLMIDPDTVDTSHLNRLAAAGLRDVGRFKTSVASRYIKEVVRGASIEEIREDCVRQRIARRLTEVDVLFGCTDSHGSRAIIQQIAYQYLIPCIDMGSVIVSNQREITHVQGRVLMLAPGLACLNCGGVLDPQQ